MAPCFSRDESLQEGGHLPTNGIQHPSLLDPGPFGMAKRTTSGPTKKAGRLGSTTPMTMSIAPVSRKTGRQRALMIRASRMTPMTVSSTPARSVQRIRPLRASRVGC